MHHGPRRQPNNTRRCRLPAAALLCIVVACGGCEIFGFAAHVVTGGESSRTVTIPAEYTGLEQKSVAVLVWADEYTQFEYPQAAGETCRELSLQLAVNIPGIKIIDPDQVRQFQADNPFWNTLPYSQLLDRLHVDRLVCVDLVRFSLHEPGNNHVWQGSVLANVGVAEAEGDGNNNLAYTSTLQAQFPEGQSIGLTDSDPQTVQLGLLRAFGRQVLDRFRDHNVVKK